MIYENNTAPYGSDIGSYPIKYYLNGSSDLSLTEVASSQKLPYPLLISILDFDDQVIQTDSVSVIEIKPANSKQSVLGQTFNLVKSGVAKFDNLVLTSPPGSAQKYIISSKVVNEKLIRKVFGDQFYSSV